MATRLTPRQELFVDHYLVCFSPKEAAIRAGYSSRNPSRCGYQALQSKPVQEEIKRRTEERRKALELVPFDAIIQNLVEKAMDPEAPVKEQMRASELLLKYESSGKWATGDTRQVKEYVDALQSQVGDIWESDWK